MGFIAICNQFEFLVCSMPHTVLSVTLSQAVGLSSSIVPWVKNSLMALLVASIAELGIRCTKASSHLGKTLWILFSLEGSICLKYFRSAIFMGGYKHSRSLHTDNTTDFKKYFWKYFLTTLKNLKVKPFRNFPLYRDARTYTYTYIRIPVYILT